MSFQISSVIVWPVDRQFPPRQIGLHIGRCSILIGGERRGKSSLLFAIDYCLGGSACLVPKDLQEKADWFGIMLVANSASYIAARRSPFRDNKMEQCFFSAGAELIPTETAKNIISTKTLVEHLFHLIGYNGRNFGTAGRTGTVGFRDLIPLHFQPQSLIGNPEQLFYRCDNSIRKTKLKAIFPELIRPALRGSGIARVQIKHSRSQELSILCNAEKLLAAHHEHLKVFALLCNKAIDYGLLPHCLRPTERWSTEMYIRTLKSAVTQADQALLISLREIPFAFQSELSGHASKVKAQGGQDVAQSRAPVETQVLKPNLTLDSLLQCLSAELRAGLETDSVLGPVIQDILKTSILKARIEEHLDSTNLYLEIEALRSKLGKIRKEREMLEEATPISKIATEFDRCNAMLSERLRFYAELMQLDLSSESPFLDLESMEIRFNGRGKKELSLSAIGGMHNWLGYHVAMFLAIHELFAHNQNAVTGRFLVFEQISQAYFPSLDEWHNRAGSKWLIPFEKVYEAISHAVVSANGALQVIVLDRFLPAKAYTMSLNTVTEDWTVDCGGFFPLQWFSDNGTVK